jgi:hypothetical protein
MGSDRDGGSRPGSRIREARGFNDRERRDDRTATVAGGMVESRLSRRRVERGMGCGTIPDLSSSRWVSVRAAGCRPEFPAAADRRMQGQGEDSLGSRK